MGNKKVAVLIDGGHLRVVAQREGIKYNPDFIDRFAHQSVVDGEEIFRILYYDCAPYIGVARLPVSGGSQKFDGSGAWLDELSRKDLFAVRKGVLKFRGYTLKKIPFIPVQPLRDEDFRPDFEQKGVDMRIGLDIASFSHARSVDRGILVTNDTDCIPAMKYGRKAGLQIVLAELPGQRLAVELLPHTDFKRPITWPS